MGHSMQVIYRRAGREVRIGPIATDYCGATQNRNVPDSDIGCVRHFELRLHPLPLFRHYTSETRRFSKSRSFCFLQLSSMRPTTIMSAKVTAHEPINCGFATA